MRPRPVSGIDDALRRATRAHAQHAATGTGIQCLSLGRGDAARRRAAAPAPTRIRAHLCPSAYRGYRAEVKYALSAEGVARIGAFLTPRTLLAFDIDGTLAPIVERPWNARVPDAVQQGLGALAQRAAVAIITGRAIADARPMLAFTPRYLVGNHGAEGVPGFERASAHCARVCREWLDALTDAPEPWRDIPGVVLEDKTFSLTFHFRHATNHDAARH